MNFFIKFESPNQPFHVTSDDFVSHSLPTPNKQEIQTNIALFLITYFTLISLYINNNVPSKFFEEKRLNKTIIPFLLLTVL